MHSSALQFHRIEPLGPFCRACNIYTSTPPEEGCSPWVGSELLIASVVRNVSGYHPSWTWGKSMLNRKSYIWRHPEAMLLAYMFSFNVYIYHLAYCYKHSVDWHRSADFIFKSTDLDNTRIPFTHFLENFPSFHILLMWWPLKIPVNKYIETWIKLVFTWKVCSLNECFKINHCFSLAHCHII